VYRAQRLADDTPVVIKLSQGASVSARQLTRYQNEYELLRSLSLDGVVRAYDFIRHDGGVGLVLEDLPGCSLKQWLAGRPGDLRERLQIAVGLADVVGAVHEADVIHKDVNSHNIVYDAGSRQCKLIDFGLATQLRSVDNAFIAPRALEGTLAYMAPEQTGRMNRATDYRADLYSLGVTLYELFTGCLPTEEADPIETVHFHIAGSPTPPCELDSRVPRALSDIVMKLLRKAPELRYQSAAGLAADLRHCLDALDAGRPMEPFTLGAEDISDRFELPQKLYGRGAEIAVLLESFERSANGEVGTVLVCGPAGIGKTALVHEVHRPITQKRGYFAAGKFEQLQQDTPFSAIVSAIKDLVDQLLTESTASVAAWRTAIRNAVGADGRVLTDAIPSLEPIVGDQPDVPELEPHEAQERFHRVFRALIQVFATPQHPLVLFFDDMQWADRASLNLITSILTAPSTKSLLLIQSYRDSEVTDAHPFRMEVQKQQALGVRIESIALDALRLNDVRQFVAEALREDASSVASLAGKIYEKTAGNPFFLRQFVLMLHTEGLISFDRNSNRFRHDAKAIDAAAITENAVELLAAKLDRLPGACRRALQLAAAIGSRFDLPTLASVCQCSPADTAAQLQPAIWDGLVVPLSRLENADPDAPGSPLVFRRFRFLHDRVHQAAYASLPEEERGELHLTIGRTLLATPDCAGPRWFDAVNHMNLGHSLIDDSAERLQLARLNIEAGTKARKSVAYELAVRNFRHAVELLGDEAWSEHYELALDAHMKLAESLCVTADYRGAFDVVDRATERTASTRDQCKLLTLKIHAHLGVDQMPQALACGRRAAALFGMELPEDPERIECVLQSEIQRILEETTRLGIESLLDLPQTEDSSQTALMAVLTHCLPAAYQTDQALFALICCKMVLLSLEHGNCSLSARAYGSFAALLSSALGRYREAYRFAKLAVDLCYRFDDPSVLSAAYFLWAMFASHWNEPIDESIEQFRKSIEFGLQTGDHQHTAYSAARCITHLHFKGTSLAELHRQTEQYLALLHRIGDVPNVDLLEPRIRFIDWLRGEGTRGPTLDGDGFSERQCERNIQTRGNQSILSHLHALRLMHRYISGDFEAALRYADASEELLQYSAGFVTRVEHNFYCSLSLAAAWYGADAARRSEYEERLAANQKELAVWAKLCPHNFRAMHRLVEAERDRLRGSTDEAMRGYDGAIADAAKSGFTHIEALAAELAARFWLQQDKKDFAGLYLDKAVNAYAIWGASGKAEDLRRSIAPVRGTGTASATPTSAATAGPERSESLELITLLKASQAISGEIVLERLLPTLMGIIVENAGADYGALILESDGQFSVRATRAAGSGKTTTTNAEPLPESAAVSQSIVNYVIRAKEHVVLANPAQRGKHQHDPYIRKRRPKSVLCAPVSHGGKLTAVIYLENNHVAEAFTPNCLEGLEILGAQIAVSIQNAELYARQRRYAGEIADANAALTKEVGERRRAEAELSRYRDRLEELVARRTEQLEKAQNKLVDLSRRAGMAEVASGVLHDVGNVMNSVNVGVGIARDAARKLRVDGLLQACDALKQHEDDLGRYLGADPAGSKIPLYLRKLGEELQRDRRSILNAMDQVLEHLEHMQQIVNAQQSHAKAQDVAEPCTLQGVVETALAINDAQLRGVEIVRDYADLPPLVIDRHQLMQILVNLISNAQHALAEADGPAPKLEISVGREDEFACIAVCDNGIGIPRENFEKIFNHGFTTKPNGHGFGLHNCANAAQRMGWRLNAHSEGSGHGASFAVHIPLETAAAYALGAGSS
jgi:predicted ATPase/signal transduction histidine kinase